jgi:hypothetical protein
MRGFDRVGLWGRGIGLLVVGLLVVLWISPAPADVIVTSDNVNAESQATNFFHFDSGRFTFGPNNGNENVFTFATAFDGAGGAAHNDNSAALTHTGTPGGSHVLSGSLGNTGSANASAFNSANSSGDANASGVINLTPVNSLLTEYAYTLTATGTSNSSTFDGNANAQASLNIGGITSQTSSSNSDFFGTTGTGPFSVNTSGILGAGSFPFSASVSGSSSDTTTFGSSDSAGLTFTLVLDPIPEPGTLALFGVGSLGLAGLGWLRRRKQALAA